MKHLSISTLTICGIAELPGQSSRSVTHVLSILDPNHPEIDAFQAYGPHQRTTLRFDDIIDPADGKIVPAPEHMTSIFEFGSGLISSAKSGGDGHLLVHCHAGVSRSTAALLSLLAQANPRENEDRLFERLRQIRPQAWPNSLMIKYADDLLGRAGRLEAALRKHYGFQLKRDPVFIEWMNTLGRGRELEMAA